MRITILYSNLSDNADFFSRVEAYMQEEQGNEVRFHDLHLKSVKFCSGCWSCWWATPGYCVHQDDMEELYRDILASDLLVFCTFLEKGFVSWEMKKVMDRLIPLIHPYFMVKEGEMHHRKRYRRYPDIAAILGGGDTPADQDLTARFFERFSRNFHGTLQWVRKETVDQEAAERLPSFADTRSSTCLPDNTATPVSVHRLLINGSPRGKRSNSRVILQAIQEGLAGGSSEWKTIDLAQVSRSGEFVESFVAAREVILIFPLYTDGTPGIVQHFLDSLPASRTPQNVSFFVQSGFPEETHSLVIAEYLKGLCRKMTWNHGGSVIRGGMEGIRLMPPSWNAKLFASLRELGGSYDSGFSADAVENLRAKKQLSAGERLVIRVLAALGLTNFYWNLRLKQNHAYKKRFEAPYAEL